LYVKPCVSTAIVKHQLAAKVINHVSDDSSVILIINVHLNSYFIDADEINSDLLKRGGAV
jgi:hypothetical protein